VAQKRVFRQSILAFREYIIMTTRPEITDSRLDWRQEVGSEET
jgi:hypothetical protein